MELLELLMKRRSVRKYTDEKIPEEKLNKIIQAGLLIPSGRCIHPEELVVVTDRDMIRKLAECKPSGAAMLQEAAAAILVMADTSDSDVWVEDCSASMENMQLEAALLDVGSCWVQCRLKQTGRTVERDGAAVELGTEDYLRQLLGIPEKYGILAILSLGMPAALPEARPLPSPQDPKVHYGKF